MLGWMLALTACLNVAMAAEETTEKEGGIIGTGIAGTITRLGSIHVNGQHIRFDPALPVAGSVPAMRAGDLQPGQTVAVTATVQEDGWQALHIRQILPLVGPVEANEAGVLTILGSAVDAGALARGITPGDWVAVSGLWRAGRVQASYLERVPEDARLARITGTYLGPDGAGRIAVSGSALEGLEPRHLRRGDVLRAFGTPVAGGLRATRIEAGLFDGQVGIVQVEGYFSPPQPDGLYTVLGSGMVAFTDRPEMIDTQGRVVQCGTGGDLQNLSGQGPASEAIAERLGC
jgi:hypothetical protein